MNLQEQLNEDLKAAMRSGDRLRVDVIRMTNAALKNAQMAAVKEAFDAVGEEGAESVDRKQALSEQAIQDVVMKEFKRRREAAELFRKGGRMDLVEREEAEAHILEGYLPRMLTVDELRPVIAAIIADLGVSGAAAMKEVMPVAVLQLKGRADGRIINQVVRELLSQ
jgi:uncharacterized protein YqeY